MNNIKIYQEIINEAIDELNLPNKPHNLYEPINYFLSLGGKRMRPVLTLMGCEMFDKKIKKATNAAIAVELFHNFSLIHDDIMDEAPLRRGKKTVHHKWNNNVGILSGDALLIIGYQHLVKYKPELAIQLIDIFNQTALEVCEGQQYDMDFETMENVSIKSYLKMIKYKTAVLLGASLKMGAIIGGATITDAEKLYDFGVNLGIAFQLQDDLLDVYADQNKFGKQVGGDIIANKKTYLLLKAIKDADVIQKKVILNLLNENDNEKKINGIKLIYAQLDIKRKTEKAIKKYYKKALKSFNDIKLNRNQKLPLLSLAQYLLEREE
jgi:geranylgeranyl diphosphate synthase type II